MRRDVACDIFCSIDVGSVLLRRKSRDDLPFIVTLPVRLRAAAFIQLP